MDGGGVAADLLEDLGSGGSVDADDSGMQQMIQYGQQLSELDVRACVAESVEALRPWARARGVSVEVAVASSVPAAFTSVSMVAGWSCCTPSVRSSSTV